MSVTSQMQDKLARLISENILTPVIYMLENEDFLEFVCFCDRNITIGEIYNVENMIKEETGRVAEIIDIRELSETERLEVIERGVLIHSEHPVIESIFARSMLEDYRMAMEERREIVQRYRETGSFYLQ